MAQAGVGADTVNFKLTDSLSFDGDDNSNPSSSSYASQSNAYRAGDYYTVSGRSNTGLGLGKVVAYSLLGLAAFYVYKRVK